MPQEAIRPEEAVRRVLPLPPERRAAALRTMLQGHPRELSRALDLLPTGGNAPSGPLQSEQAQVPAVRVGSYTLRSVLGEGGFGVVWLATQDEPLRRSVALKLLRPDRVDPVSRSRFESERRLLALLSHPALVKVFEAGETDDGRPWFSMELAQGAPITEACDAARLPVNERMRLMADVARGMHHAHEHGLVHRDLKPSNILLAFEADQTNVKVIDFGVAHATFQPSDPDEKAGAVIGTPDYLAPELLRVRVNGPDVRSDIYALGAVLRRLAVGSDMGDRRDGLLSALHALDPASQRQVAEERHETVASLRHRVEGDLDAIISHCLADDPRHRYASALELAQDLDRFRHGDPVVARGRSLGYIGVNMAKRHASAIASALLVMLIALLGTGWALHERALAMQARDEAEQHARNVQQANAYIVELLDEIINAPGMPQRSSVEILTEASRLAGLRLSDDPAQEARVRAALGQLWISVKQPDTACQEFVRAETLFESLDMQQPLADARIAHAAALRKTGQFSDAAKTATLAVQQAAKESPADPDDEARALIELARDAMGANDLEGARAALSRAAKLLRSAPGNVRALQSDLESARAQLGPVHATTPPKTASPTP